MKHLVQALILISGDDVLLQWSHWVGATVVSAMENRYFDSPKTKNTSIGKKQKKKKKGKIENEGSMGVFNCGDSSVFFIF